jgi:vacuolar protein 8
MAILQASRGWRRVLGLKAYTARATYPDLYVYFDGADQTSPINRLGMRAFSAYPSDIGGLPAHGIRGEMVAIRLEPPRVRSFRFDQGEAAAEAHAVEDRHASQFVQTIEVEEMRDTLLFYTTRDAAEIARDRDLRRMMAIDGGRSTWPEMPTMPSRGGAGVGTGADAPALSKDERLQRLVQRVRNSSADAAGALADMRDNESRVAIARAGGIVPLVAMLTAQDPAAGAEAARALRSLAINAENKVLIAQAGAIAPLVTLVQSGTAGQKEQAAGALRNLADNNAENQVSIAQAGG